MMGMIDDKLAELGIELPEAAAPAANYVPFCISGNLIFISGQLPMKDGSFAYQGKLGSDISQDQGIEAAKLCAIGIIAQAKAALDGDLDRVVRIVKLGGFVNATSDFTNHPKVINGASDLMVEVFGDKGRHSRFAMGAGSLPLGVSVEIDAVVEFA
ncbi:MAG: RidA family protein [Alphaproteobacteria bacterium]|nr:RidA family protein [Alphaproteobacteria bacterium]